MSTESEEVAQVASYYGAEVLVRPEGNSTSGTRKAFLIGLPLTNARLAQIDPRTECDIYRELNP